MGSDKNSKNDKSGGDSDNNKDKSNSPPKTGIPNGDPGDLIAKVPKD
jgi:hypothetical protein